MSYVNDFIKFRSVILLYAREGSQLPSLLGSPRNMHTATSEDMVLLDDANGVIAPLSKIYDAMKEIDFFAKLLNQLLLTIVFLMYRMEHVENK